MNYQNNSAQSELGALDVSLNLDGNVEVCKDKQNSVKQVYKLLVYITTLPYVYQLAGVVQAANWPGTTAAR